MCVCTWCMCGNVYVCTCLYLCMCQLCIFTGVPHSGYVEPGHVVASKAEQGLRRKEGGGPFFSIGQI